MRGWMKWSPARAVVAGFTVLALLAAEGSSPSPGTRHEAEFRPPAHAETIAATASSKHPLSLLQQRSSPSPARPELPAPAHNLARPKASVSLALRLAPPLPPARMRYRRTTHDPDGEPPA